VAGAGDVNGDGRDDVIIGAGGADNHGRTSGSSYVVYGSASASTMDLASVSAAQGFRIDGANADDVSGVSVAGAGDVNGDGRDDVIIGAAFADNNGRTNSGSSYVIYGSASPTNIDLASLNITQGFRIDGANAGDLSGDSVAGAGDVSSDGRDDVIVGAFYASNNGRDGSGSSYVVRQVDATPPQTTVENAAGKPIVTPTSFNGPVATFTLDGGDAAGITATIDWGDAITSNATISGPGADGRYTVNGAHTYVVDGRYTATIRIRDAAGRIVTVTSSVLVYAPTGNGSGTFAISDSTAAVDTPVTFWGSQWSSSNPFNSGAGAPSAFKGYAAAFSGGGGPACGATWTTGPGNSANPPNTIPQYIGVVVTSGVTKSGSTISGDVKRIVVVKTDPGYAGNPAHPGTGKVVAVACVS
jgi:hypothetical protein